MMNKHEYEDRLWEIGKEISERLDEGKAVDIPFVGTLTGNGGFNALAKRGRMVNGGMVFTEKREITSANVLGVEAGTNGYCGGDTGHGSRTYIRIVDLGSTDMTVKPAGRFGNDGFVLELGGDCELDTIIQAFEWVAQTLRKQSEGKNDE